MSLDVDFRFQAPDARAPGAFAVPRDGRVPLTRPIVHVLDRRDPEVAAALGAVVLPRPERDLLAGIHHADRRAELTERRAALRLAVGAAIGLAPPLVPLERGPVGEPLVTGLGLHVSASSRGHRLAVGLWNRPIGVDVEAPIAEAALPRTRMHAREIAAVDAAAPAERAITAALVWAAKEAVWKAAVMPVSRDPRGFAAAVDALGQVTVADPDHPAVSGIARWLPELEGAVAVVVSI
ncbi:4'-phosphopantetheinyl transferase family protein [Phreatobacter stygius]|uniref:4'-phosphopantetheinyl transferase superfamily protein n=1 Tax=Phreatobacter stygius TaxID=1940610 RepID=A0A4D7B121_9HYPH|nr:4'-phosphopantetheinyl transferase superfamily protein [Phreatobacter stygius]QCI64458.1 4'-phosphopantetheinyl transferase superfamily protein [Phreatobacter stygius]